MFLFFIPDFLVLQPPINVLSEGCEQIDGIKLGLDIALWFAILKM